MAGSSNEDTPEIADLPADERLSLLAVDRRSLTLDILDGKTTQVELRELAAEIAAREEGVDAADKEAVDRVAITLHHTHLPKMADAGILEYDPGSHRIDPEGVSTRLARDSPSIAPTNRFAAVAVKHRQFVLKALEQNEWTTLEELSTMLADNHTGDATSDVIATQLHHNHLPRLDKLGFVHYDPDIHVVEATELTTD